MTRAMLLLLLLAGQAHAQTPCPTVSDNVSILSVNIVGAPKPVGFAGLDLETNYLTVSFYDRTAQMFISVPRGLVQGFQTQWSSLLPYPQAIMQERSTCPLLQETHTVPGVPLATQTTVKGPPLATQNRFNLALEATQVAPGPVIWSRP